VSKKDVGEQVLGERRALHLLRKAPVASPMERHRAAAVGDHEFYSAGNILEEVALQQLHERRRVGIHVVRAGEVEVRVA